MIGLPLITSMLDEMKGADYVLSNCKGKKQTNTFKIKFLIVLTFLGGVPRLFVNNLNRIECVVKSALFWERLS